MAKSYYDKLTDPRWQKRRLEIFQRDNFTCCDCQSTEKTLNVHHLLYKKGCEPWEYEDEDLQTLCGECHKSREYVLELLKENVKEIQSRGKSYLISCNYLLCVLSLRDLDFIEKLTEIAESPNYFNSEKQGNG